MNETDISSIGECNRCGHVFPAGYRYTWCVECRTELPDVVKAKVMKEAPADGRAVRLAVKGRVTPCPLCQGEWFEKREHAELVRSDTLVPGWIRSTGTSYVCVDCGHIVSFAR